jgi:hypothetical protein
VNSVINRTIIVHCSVTSSHRAVRKERK